MLRAPQYDMLLRLLLAVVFGRPAVSTKLRNSPSPRSIDTTNLSNPSASSRMLASPEVSNARR